MKKRILTCITVVAVLLFLILFAVWQRQTDAPESTPSTTNTTNASFDAQILIDPNEPLPSDQYDLKHANKIGNHTDAFLPVGSNHNGSFFYQEKLTVHINRSLDLNNEDFCHYGLFEKNNKQFAVFHSEISSQIGAERLCHLLLCYRDYFPVLIFGEFDEETHTLLTEVCRLSSAAINGISYYYQNLLPMPQEKSGSLLLTFETAPRQLNLNKKMVALTYDDGPSKNTQQILQVLTEQNAKATFFVNGTHVSTRPAEIEAIFAANCEIGNHTNLHELFEQNTQSIIRKTIEVTNQKVRSVIGIGTFVVRPPGGGTLDRYQQSVSVGYPIVRWSLDTFDYTENKSAASILESIRSQVKNGDIILMHDTQAVTAEVCRDVVTYLLSQDFQLVTVSELLEFASEGAENDRVYNQVSSAE